jgi:hypothetical protein
LDITVSREPTTPPPITVVLYLSTAEANALDSMCCADHVIVPAVQATFGPKQADAVSAFLIGLRPALRPYLPR